MSTVCHINDNLPGAIYIGRRMNRRGLAQSAFANPYPLETAATRAELLDLYRAHLDANPQLFAVLPALRGVPLACWCRHDGEPVTERNRCHGDVLAALLDEHTDAELHAMATKR